MGLGARRGRGEEVVLRYLLDNLLAKSSPGRKEGGDGTENSDIDAPKGSSSKRLDPEGPDARRRGTRMGARTGCEETTSANGLR